MTVPALRLWLAAVALAPALALACIHSPNGYKGAPVSEREKLALLFHDGTNAHLVIRTILAANGGLPEKMAWVIPLPSLPSKYEEAPPNLFSELFHLIPRKDPWREVAKPAAKAKMEPKMAAPAPAIRVHEAQVVGSYQVQPLEILAESAGGELNEWLSKNGFGTVPPENQKHYLRKGAVFLALRVEALKGAVATLKPLHIVYRDDRLRLPLKFSTHSGSFDVRLYTVTDQAPSRDALTKFGLRVGGLSYELGGAPPAVTKVLGARKGFITEFVGTGYNARHRVAEWKEDPWLEPHGRGPGGAPGGSDSAASWPGRPLIGIDPESVPYEQLRAEDWAWRGGLVLLFLGTLWWCYRNVRKLATAIAARAARKIANGTMLLGVSIWAVWAMAFFTVHVWRLWGSVPDAAAELLGWAGLGLVALGALLRLGAAVSASRAGPS